ncbi:MAG TPA: hypothetical protein VLA49_10000 [Anaerolineales bacterium]|nr:hypothetical protein [Anaerolineales bacterium]
MPETEVATDTPLPFTSTVATYQPEETQRLTQTKTQIEQAPATPTKTPTNTATPTQRVSITPTLTGFPTARDNSIRPAGDLVFLSAGELSLWSRFDGSISRLLQAQKTSESTLSVTPVANNDRVAEYTLDRINQRLVILRSRGISANGVELFNLELFDLRDASSRVLLEETPAVYNIGVSSDGEWVSYTFQPRGGGPIFSINTEGNAEPIIVGVCQARSEDECDISWHSEHAVVMWSDLFGVWWSAPPEFTPVKVIDNQIKIVDLGGKEMTIDVNISSMRWSPKGRYLLALIKPLRSEVRWQGVIDTLRGEISEVPGTYEYELPTAAVDWLPDGSLLVIHKYSGANRNQMQVTVYNLYPTSASLLIPHQSFNIDLNNWAQSEILSNEEIEIFPRYVQPESNRRVWVIFSSTQAGSISWLYQVDIKYRSITESYDLPQGVSSIIWSVDNSEAIFTAQPDGYYYFNTDNLLVYDIKPLLGKENCCFQWVP